MMSHPNDNPHSHALVSGHKPTSSPGPGPGCLLTLASGLLAFVGASFALYHLGYALARARQERPGCSIEVRSSPPGAMVWLDDRYQGMTPSLIHGLGEGWHLFRIEKRDCKPVIQNRRIAGENGPLSVELERLPSAALQIASSPASAEVFVDGRVLGETPLRVEVQPGLHSLTASAEGYEPWEQRIEVGVDEQAAVHAELKSKMENFLLERIHREPWRVASAYELAHYYLLAGRHERALEILEQGLRSAIDPRAPTGEGARLVQEISYIYQGQFIYGTPEVRKEVQPRLIELVEQVARDQPRNVYAASQLGIFYRGLGRDEEALRVYHSAHQAMKSQRAKRYHASLAADTVRSIVQRKLAQAHQARQEFTTLSAQAQSAETSKAANAAELRQQAEGKSQIMKARYLECIEMYESAGKNFAPSEPAMDCFHQAATIHLSFLNDPAKYVETIRRVIQQFPESNVSAVYRRQLGDFFYGRKEYAATIEEYRRYLADYPGRADRPEVWNRIAQCFMEQGDKAAAAREYEAFLKGCPGREQDTALLAKLIQLYEELQEKGKAQEGVRQLAEGYPHSSEAEKYEPDAARRAQRALARERLGALRSEQARLTELKAKHVALLAEAKKLRDAQSPQEAQVIQDAEAARNAIQAECQEVMGRYRRLIEEFRAFSEARAAQLEIIQICSAFLAEPGKVDERTQEEYRAFIRLFPRDTRSPSFFLQMSHHYQQHGLKEEAIRELKCLLASYPESDQAPGVQWQVINLLSAFKSYSGRERYLEELERFVKDYPGNDLCATALFTLATVYYYQSYPGDLEKAIAAFARLDEAFPHATITNASEYYRAGIDDGIQRVESSME